MPGIEIGRLCVKIAGRDAGKECLIIDVLDNNLVLIDGNTRRRKCNIKHLEFLPQTAKIKKGATHSKVAKALKKLGFEVKKKVKSKTKKTKKIKKKSKKKLKSKKGKKSKKKKSRKKKDKKKSKKGKKSKKKTSKKKK